MYIVHVVWSVSFSNVKLGALYNYVIPIVLMEPLNVYDYQMTTLLHTLLMVEVKYAQQALKSFLIGHATTAYAKSP